MSMLKSSVFQSFVDVLNPLISQVKNEIQKQLEYEKPQQNMQSYFDLNEDILFDFSESEIYKPQETLTTKPSLKYTDSNEEILFPQIKIEQHSIAQPIVVNYNNNKRRSTLMRIQSEVKQINTQQLQYSQVNNLNESLNIQEQPNYYEKNQGLIDVSFSNSSPTAKFQFSSSDDMSSDLVNSFVQVNENELLKEKFQKMLKQRLQVQKEYSQLFQKALVKKQTEQFNANQSQFQFTLEKGNSNQSDYSMSDMSMLQIENQNVSISNLSSIKKRKLTKNTLDSQSTHKSQRSLRTLSLINRSKSTTQKRQLRKESKNNV
eukprot:403376059